MPMPKPKPDESHDDFIERCMSNSVMMEDFPEQNQRLAVCQTQWENRKSLHMKTKHLKAKLQIKDLPADAPEGSVQALFSVFNVVDSSREVVMPSFFVDGQEVALSSWGHRWDKLPVGKGIIRITQDGAVFDGQFFLNTTHGRDHYETIKAMGDLQEWSFGFRVLEARPGEFDGQEVLFLLRGETYEVSPVLIGDNRETLTMGIKSLNDANSKDSNTTEILDSLTSIQVYTNQINSLVAEMKEGRAISSARRNQLADSVSTLRQVADTIETMLKETAPKDDDDKKGLVSTEDVLSLNAQFELMRSELITIGKVL